MGISKTLSAFLKTTVFFLLGWAAACTSANAGQDIPGKKQYQPIVLRNATVHTVTKGTITNATVVFENGIITQVGTSVTIPPGSKDIDCSGKHIYPGFIAPSSQIGISEIDAVRSTRDASEVGQFNPNVRTETAYNPDSEIIPTIRFNGILLANVCPTGDLVSGMSSLMRLDGWTREDISVLPSSAMMVNWPRMDVIRAWWMRKPEEEQKKEIAAAMQQFMSFFREAQAYFILRKSTTDTSRKDIRFEAMRRVFARDLPVIVSAYTRSQIEAAVDFSEQYNIRVVLLTGSEVRSCLPQVKKANIPVIVQRVHSLPDMEEDPYDGPYSLPADLERAGILFAISDNGGWQQRNLPFLAGTAMAFGLSETMAEKALTINVAEILGVGKMFGSLEVGKSATMFVSSGNALDGLTNRVEVAFIDGREVDLSTRHTRLSKKYFERLNR